MQLYGRKWSRRQLEEHVGRLEQIGGIRRFQGDEGFEKGVEQIQVRTGAGLSYYVSPSKGLDISLAEFGGVPLSWQSPNGDVHPSYYHAQGTEWLRTASGGLLMTCGMTQVGAPCQDEGEPLGMHGRAHHLPARQVAAEGKWMDDEYQMRIAGIVEETSIFGDCLRLTREITSQLGCNRLMITDVVENIGFEDAPHMMLYHFNFGFPLMTEETTIVFPSGKVTARDPETPTEGYDRWQAPEPGYRERVYYHHMDTQKPSQNNHISKEEPAKVTIRNPHFPLVNGGGSCPLQLSLSWDAQHLPEMVQWKMPGAGTHVLGIEPSNCKVEGRAIEKEKGSLVMLSPGEHVTYSIELDLSVCK